MQHIDKAVKKNGEFYGIKPIQAYAKYAGFAEAEKITDKNILLTQLKGFLKFQDGKSHSFIQAP